MRKTLSAILLLIVTAGLSHPASADCTNPAAPPGAIIYNTDQNVPQVCSDSTWIALGALNPSAGGSGCTNPAKPEGTIIYNDEIHMPQYCDGDDWRQLISIISGKNIGQPCGGGYFGGRISQSSTVYDLVVSPKADEASLAWGDATTTGATSGVDGPGNTATIVGTAGNFAAAEHCDALTTGGHDDWYLPSENEMVVVISNSSLVGDLHTARHWTSTEDGATDARWVQVDTDGAYQNGSSAKSTTGRPVRCARREPVGSCVTGSSGFLTFTDMTDQATSTLVTSNILQVNVTGSSSISVSGDGSPEYRICANASCSVENHTWGATAGTINSGEFLQLRLTTSASLSTTYSATVTVGGSSDRWDVTTAASTPSIAYIGTSDVSTGTPHTFTNHAIGAAAADRLVVVVAQPVGTDGSGEVTSLTIGGNAATRHTTEIGQLPQAIFSLLVTSGTTATIEANTVGGASGLKIHVYTITSSNSTTPVSASQVNASGTTAAQLTFTPLTNGVTVYGATGQASDAHTVSWSGSGTTTEDNDTAHSSSSTRRGSAGNITGHDNSNATLSLTLDSSGSALKRLHYVHWY